MRLVLTRLGVILSITLFSSVFLTAIALSQEDDGFVILTSNVSITVDDEGNGTGTVLVGLIGPPAIITGQIIIEDKDIDLTFSGSPSTSIGEQVQTLRFEASDLDPKKSATGFIVLLTAEGAFANGAVTMTPASDAAKIKAISVLTDDPLEFEAGVGDDETKTTLLVLNPNSGEVEVTATLHIDGDKFTASVSPMKLPAGSSEVVLTFMKLKEGGEAHIVFEFDDSKQYVAHKTTILSGPGVLEFGLKTVGIGLGAGAFYWMLTMLTPGRKSDLFIAPSGDTGVFEGWGKRTAAIAGSAGILGTVLSQDLIGDTIGGIDKGLFIGVQVVFLVLLVLDDFVFGAFERDIGDHFTDKQLNVEHELPVKFTMPGSTKAVPVMDVSSETPKPLVLEDTRPALDGDVATLTGFITASALTTAALVGELATLAWVFGNGIEDGTARTFTFVFIGVVALALIGHLTHGWNATERTAKTLKDAREATLAALKKDHEEEARAIRAEAHKNASADCDDGSNMMESGAGIYASRTAESQRLVTSVSLGRARRP